MAASVAKVFFQEIMRLHGLPSSIVSDHDPMFISALWKELLSLAGVKLQYISFPPPVKWPIKGH